MAQRRVSSRKSDKQEALELIERLPDHTSLDTIISELLFREKVLRGLKQLDEGQVVSHESVEEEMRNWRPSVGR